MSILREVRGELPELGERPFWEFFQPRKPNGTVHSLGDDVVVFEVQQNSDVTFRLYDWGHVDLKTDQPRALQVDQALACIDFAEGPVGPVTPVVEATAPVERERLFRCETFLAVARARTVAICGRRCGKRDPVRKI